MMLLCLITKPRISIHALRAEGDMAAHGLRSPCQCISIHALRAEGDMAAHGLRSPCQCISIHALRAEGDRDWTAAKPELPGQISIHALRAEGDHWRDSFVRRTT